MRKILALCTIISILGIGCKDGNQQNADQKEKSTSAESADKKYTLTPFEPSTQFEDAQLQSMTYADGIFNFNVQGTDYELGAQTPDKDSKMCANSAKGQHIHLIINDEPYAAKYESTFGYDVPDGEHYLLAFLSRSYHESIKGPKSAIHARVSVKDKTLTSLDGITESMVFYSRPKGTYVGKSETDKVMLDFYMVNADLGSGYTIEAKINDEVHSINKWQPYYIEGLPMGDNTVELTLLDSNGNVVNSPYNPVKRTFTLKSDEIPGE